MAVCKKCNGQFEPSKGLLNYCSLRCRNSRGPRTDKEKQKISIGVLKKLPYIKQLTSEQRSEWARKGGLSRSLACKRKFELRVATYPWEELRDRERRERIRREQDGKCIECGIGDLWNNKPLKLELDHINGVRTDNTRENLRFLCPNCHSQTNTYKVGNVKNVGNVYYTDEQIIQSLKNNDSAYKSMKELGMNPHGGNYSRLRKIVKKYNLELSYSF